VALRVEVLGVAAIEPHRLDCVRHQLGDAACARWAHSVPPVTRLLVKQPGKQLWRDAMALRSGARPGGVPWVDLGGQELFPIVRKQVRKLIVGRALLGWLPSELVPDGLSAVCLFQSPPLLVEFGEFLFAPALELGHFHAGFLRDARESWRLGLSRSG